MTDPRERRKMSLLLDLVAAAEEQPVRSCLLCLRMRTGHGPQRYIQCEYHARRSRTLIRLMPEFAAVSENWARNCLDYEVDET